MIFFEATISQKLLADFEGKLMQFQRHVIGLLTNCVYEFKNIGNIDMLSDFTVTQRERGDHLDYRIQKTMYHCSAVHYGARNYLHI